MSRWLTGSWPRRGGTPLELLELPRGCSPAELAGGFGLPQTLPLRAQIRENFSRWRSADFEQTRLLLAVAAVTPPVTRLHHRAARHLGLGVDVAEQAEETEYFDTGGIGGQVVFRHPLMRSAAYRAVSPGDRRKVHAALGSAGDRRADRSRSTGLAPGAGDIRTRRGGRGGARAVGRAGAGTRGPGRRRGLPGALDGADGRPGAPSGAHAGGGPGQHPSWLFNQALDLLVWGRER